MSDKRTPRVLYRGGPLDGQTRAKTVPGAPSVYVDERGGKVDPAIGDYAVSGRTSRGQATPPGVYRHAGSTPTAPRVHVYDWVPWSAVPPAEPLGSVPLVEPATSVEQDVESFIDDLLGA
jgi:hypothetical protein